MDQYEYMLQRRLAESGDVGAKREIVDFLCDQDDVNLSDDQKELTRAYLTDLAESEESHFMLLLGTRYYNGQTGFQKDYELARYWYEKAAGHDDSWALCNLGYIYAYGRGVEPDANKAFYYYMKSASMNNPNALYKIGDSYHNGESVGQDYDAAYYWYSRAKHFATKEDEDEHRIVYAEVLPNILYRLGGCALKGHGTEVDPLLALDYLQSAEIQLYALTFQGNLFAGDTLGKVQNLIDEVREVLDRSRNSSDAP
jgi:TPR repeat protein